MNAIRSYVRPTVGSKATTSKAVRDLRAAERGQPLVRTMPLQVLNLSTNSPGYSTSRHSGSRPLSVHPDGDFRNNSRQDIDDLKCAVAINWVYHVQNENRWNGNSGAEGVVLRKAPRQFNACPDELRHNAGGVFDAARELNARVIGHRHSLAFSC